MMKIAAFALLFCTTSALVVEEEIVPLRDVSPEEFHNLNLRQELEAKPKAPVVEKKNKWERIEDQKKADLAAHRAAKRELERKEELEVYDQIHAKQIAEEVELQKEA